MHDQLYTAIRRPRYAAADPAQLVPSPVNLRAAVSVDLFYGRPLWCIEIHLVTPDGFPLALGAWGEFVHDVRLFALRAMRAVGDLDQALVELQRERSVLFARPLSRNELLLLPYIPIHARPALQAAAL